MTQANRDAVLAELRAHIARVAPARAKPGTISTGIPALESRLGGWPCPGLSVIEGRAGMGRLGVILPTLSRLTREGRWVAVVDTVSWLHPPGLEGVDLSKLLLVRPGARAGWAATQLARCGGFPVVVLLDPPRLGRGSRSLQHAAEEGQCSVLLLCEKFERGLPLSARLELLPGGRLYVKRGAHRPSADSILWRRGTAN
jgi:hypothetical protein